MNHTVTKLTYQDYLQIPEDYKRHEIIDGEHYVTPSPSTRHQIVSINLASLLNQWVKNHRLGRVISAPIDVILSDSDIVIPDIIYVSKSRSSIITDKNIQGAPDLMIEILSSSTGKRDKGIKKKLYEIYQVSEYWIVDPNQESVDIFTLENGKFHHLPPADPIVSPLFPRLQIPFSSLLV